MNRKTFVAGLIFVGLILVTVGLLRSPEKGTRPKEGAPSPVAKITAQDVNILEVTKGGNTTVIKKDGDTYSLVKPLAFPAEKDSAKQAFDALEKIEWDHIVSDKKTRHDEYEVGKNAVRVVAKKDDKTLLDLYVGKSAAQGTMVRLEGKDEVWSATGILKYLVDKDATDWRDKSILSFAEKDAEKLTIATQDGAKIVLAKPAPTDGGAPADWKILESTTKIDRQDKTIATGVIAQLASLKAMGFADNAKPEETGLDRPEWTLTVGLAGGKELSVLFGKKKGEDETFVRLATNPQVYFVKKWSIDRALKRPIEFREKILCDLVASEITEVAVTNDKDSYALAKAGEEFKLTKPAGVTLDTTKVNGITSAFSDWKAQSFAEGAKNTGLAKPSSSITATSSVKGRRCQLKVGSETPEKGNFYVQVVGQPDVMVVPKWSLDRVLVKVDDLKKK